MARQLLTDAIFPVKERDLDLTIPPDEDAVYYLRPLSVGKLREFVDTNKRKLNRHTHQKEVDGVGLSNDSLDYVIARWEGVKANGVEAPCDLEHKLQLPAEVQAALVQAAQIGQVTPEARAASKSEPQAVR